MNCRILPALALLACALPAIAVPLASAPGSTLLSGTTIALDPQLAGTVVEDRITPFSFLVPPILGTGGGTVSGSVQERVVRSVDGTLDFYWRVFNDAGSVQPIGPFTIAEFSTTAYDGNWRIDGLGDAPAIKANHDGSTVKFSFDDIWDIVRYGGVAPGDSSRFVFLDTDALSYGQTGSMTLGSFCPGSLPTFCVGGQSTPMPTFAPSPVPEPSAVLMALVGAGVLLWRGTRRA